MNKYEIKIDLDNGHTIRQTESSSKDLQTLLNNYAEIFAPDKRSLTIHDGKRGQLVPISRIVCFDIKLISEEV